MLCNVKWINEQIIIERKKTVVYSIYFPALSYLDVFVFVKCSGNNHDCLGVMQSLYYKSSGKHILKSEEDRESVRDSELELGTLRERKDTD